MTHDHRVLLEEAKKLPDDERESLAYEILETLGREDDPLSPEWRDEIDRRIARAVSGQTGSGLDWRKALNEIRGEVDQERGRRP